MRIISSFKDYYDTVSYSCGYDSDPNIVYVREKEEIGFKTAKSHKDNKNLYYHKELLNSIYDASKFVHRYKFHYTSLMKSGLFFFCGKAIPYWDFYINSSRNIIYGHSKLIEVVTKDFFYNKKRSEIESQNISKQSIYSAINSLDEMIKCLSIGLDNYNNSFCYRNKNFPWQDIYDVGDEIHKHYNCPIIQYDPCSNCTLELNVIKNPLLKEYDFMTQYDPYTAYQEIEMYLGTNLAKQKDPNVPMSDELKAEIHGFDKWSFRKQSNNK